MSVKPGDIRFYGSANMPDADGATTGGALDASKKITFADVTPSGTMDYVSDSASDTATTIAITVRDATGAIQTETKTLTGTTKVAGSQTCERLLKGVQGGTTPVGNIAVISHTAVISSHTAQAGSANATGITPALFALQAGDGASVASGQIIRLENNTPSGVQFLLREIIATSGYGTDVVAVSADWSTLPTSSTTYSIYQGFFFNLTPNRIAQVRRPFYNASSDIAQGVNKDYFEKIFAVNDNTSIALTVVQISKNTDPSSGVLDIVLTTSLNDTGTVANRQTAPVTGLNSIAATTLNGGINAAVTALVPTAFTGFPGTIVNGGYFIQIDSEVMFVTAGAGTLSWTIARAQCGTTAASHSNGAAINQYISNGAATVTLSVPSPGNLPSGAAPNAAGAQGVWLHLHLTPGLAPAKTSFTLRETGTTV